jgi:hypothetical protein
MHYENRFLGTFQGHSKRPNMKKRDTLAGSTTECPMKLAQTPTEGTENGKSSGKTRLLTNALRPTSETNFYPWLKNTSQKTIAYTKFLIKTL